MFCASVEAETGDRLNVLLADDDIAGDLLANFLLSLSAYCIDKSNNSWLDDFEAVLQGNICEVLLPILKGFYSGDWDYNEDEYQFFVKRMGVDTVSEDEFKRTIRELQLMWIDIDNLCVCVETLLGTLAKANLRPVMRLYEPPYTENELKALLETLKTLKGRGAEKARIAFTFC